MSGLKMRLAVTEIIRTPHVRCSFPATKTSATVATNADRHTHRHCKINIFARQRSPCQTTALLNHSEANLLGFYIALLRGPRIVTLTHNHIFLI